MPQAQQGAETHRNPFYLSNQHRASQVTARERGGSLGIQQLSPAALPKKVSQCRIHQAA